MDLTLLTIAPNEIAANLIAGMLRANGVPSEVRVANLAVASPAGGPLTGSAERGSVGAREILVPVTAADQARELLEAIPADAHIVPADSSSPDDFVDSGDLPYLLQDESTGDLIGELDEVDLSVLHDLLVEDPEVEASVYVNTDTVEMLDERGASDRALDGIRRALHDGEGDVRWIAREDLDD